MTRPATPETTTPLRRAELLLPAGDLEKLRTAVLYGADAIYAGTPDLSLRTQSGFGIPELREGIAFAHEHGKRVYLTLNLFSHNKDVERLPGFVATLREIGPDGVIVADLGVFEYLREHAPELELHVSTQANAVSWLTVRSWQRLGAALCVLAREVSFAELREIRERCPDIRLETFVHGSMCMTYSGRCLLSNYMAERGANQGSCAHSCRWKYKLKVQAPDGSLGTIDIDQDNMNEFRFFLEEEFRPGQLYPIEEDASGSYILNSRDLCLMPKLDEYLSCGLDSLKVEGRNKSAYYVAVVGRAYRLAIDAYYENPAAFDPAPYLAELATVASRGYTIGFHGGRLDSTGHDYSGGQSLSDFEFAGLVREQDDQGLVVEVRNRLLPGDVLEFLPPARLDCVRLRLYEYESAETGELKQAVTAGEGRAIRVPWSAFHAEDIASLRALLPNRTVVRKAKALNEQQHEQLRQNRESQRFELGLIPAEALGSARSARPAGGPIKPPRLGAEGCCGLGCNGCLPFWNDEKYEKARTRLLDSRRPKLERGEAASAE
ncbi:MAG TPA: peptidase U32 family protein [Polyangiaceae bacterium]|nr:peptidase U32 family protein [Polyangiaceae bacterium]